LRSEDRIAQHTR